MVAIPPGFDWDEIAFQFDLDALHARGPAALRQVFDRLASAHLLHAEIRGLVRELSTEEAEWVSRFERFDFTTEPEASSCLRALLAPYFVLRAEVGCRHLLAGNRLKVDFLARPKPGVDFPFDWFGIEVKRGARHGAYNRGLRQAVDDAACVVDDDRVARLAGERIQRVFLFPGVPDLIDDHPSEAYWVNRFVGLFHVGMIYVGRHFGRDDLYFMMSADRVWSSNWGAIGRPHNIRQRVASGVLRIVK